VRIPNLVAVAFAVFGADAAYAAEQVVLGTTFVVRDSAPVVDPTRRSVVVKGREIASNDTLVGNPVADGATLEINANGAFQESQTLTLPAAFWTTKGTPPAIRYIETIAASAIFGLTKPLPNYWSATTDSDPATAATEAWSRRFRGRYESPTFDMDAWPKTADRLVRAVRQQ
jgi:hypothetical protein